MATTVHRVLAVGILASAVVLTPVAGSAAAPPLLAGVVMSNGAPVAGATITTEVWPSQAVLDKIKKGQTVPTVTVKAVRTDAKGRFGVYGNLAILSASYRGLNGQVDVAVDASSGTRRARWAMSLKPTVAGFASMTTHAAEQVSNVRFELGTNKAALAKSANLSAVSLKGPVPLDNTNCGAWASDGYRGPFNAIWGDASAHGPALGGFRYTIGASHRLAVVAGWNSDGYGASGSITVTTNQSSELASGATLVNQRMYGKFYWTQYHAQCPAGIRYQMNPNGHIYYPAYHYTIGHIYNGHCFAVGAGTTFTRTHGTNYDYTYGASIYGSSYESQAGWSSSIELGLTWRQSGGLCYNGSFYDTSTLWDGR